MSYIAINNDSIGLYIMHAEIAEINVLKSGEFVAAGNHNPLRTKIFHLNITYRNITEFYIPGNIGNENQTGIGIR